MKKSRYISTKFLFTFAKKTDGKNLQLTVTVTNI